MQHAFPNALGFNSFLGYDPLVEASAPNVLVRRYMFDTDQGPWPELGICAVVASDSTPFVATEPGNFEPPVHLNEERLTVHRLRAPRPMAFVEATGQELRADSDLSGTSLEADKPVGGPVILNYLWRPEFRADLPGARVEPDEYGRIRVTSPEAWSRLRLRFAPIFSLGLVAGFTLLLACAVGLRFLAPKRTASL